MLLDQQQFVRCPNGKHSFWSDDAKYFCDITEFWKQHDYVRRNRTYVKSFDKPILQDFTDALTNKNFKNNREEVFLRLEYWRTNNDQRLVNEDETFLSETQINNIHKLLKILDGKDFFWEAELLREIGEYSKCKISISKHIKHFKRNQLYVTKLREFAEKNDFYHRFVSQYDN